MFGLLKGMALPLVFFPSTFLTALTQLLVPELSEAAATGNNRQIQKVVGRAIRITFLLSAPATAVFLLFSNQLGALVYSRADVAPLLMALAPLMPLMYSESVVAGILRGLGEQKKALQYNIIDSVMRIVLIIALVPSLGMTGFLSVMVASNLLTSILKLHRLLKITTVRFEWSKWLMRPAVALLISCLGGLLLYKLPFFSTLSALQQLISGGIIVVGLYVLSAWLFEENRDIRALVV
jgi:stage V sporulation protein B